MAKPSKFFSIMFSEWGSGLSGPASVPFAVLALFSSGAIQKSAYASLAIILGFFSAYRIWSKENERTESAKNEIEKLKEKPPEMDLKIEDLAFHHSPGELGRWQYADVFIQATIRLRYPITEQVQYVLEVIRQGFPMKATFIDDIERWEVIDRRYFNHIAEGSRARFTLNAHRLSTSLSATVVSEGWLHFRVDGLADSEISNSRLRLSAVTPRGNVDAEKDINGAGLTTTKNAFHPKRN